MRVGLEVSSSLSANLTGVQRYIQGVVEGLSSQEGVEVVRLLKISRWRKRGLLPASSIASCWYGPSLGLFRGAPDVVHSSDPTLPYATWGVPLVATIHDLYLAQHAREIPREVREKKLKSAQKACSRSQRIIVPTQSIKTEVADLVGGDDKVIAVPHGISDKFRTPIVDTNNSVRQQQRPYLLTFCGGPRKNLETTVEAFRQLKLDAQGWKLLAIGKPTDAERNAAHRLLHQDAFSFRWGVSDEALIDLYTQANAVCYASLYEGFGFPVLEGMACGRPVVTTGEGATAEVAGGYAALVEPLSAESIGNGIERAMSMSATDLVRAKRYASQFSWTTCANRLVGVYKDLM